MSEKDPHEGPEREASDEITPEQQMLFDIMDQSIAKCQAGAPAETNGAPTETQRSGFGGERRDSEADELSPQAEASERSSLTGPPSKPSEAVSMGRGEARERAELSPQGEAEQSGLCLDDVSRETSETPEKAPPPPQKNSPSSFYRYLLVLFGAAFLMLLLAYFVQQRNNDATQEDLELLTASREELLASIKDLEETNHDLVKDNGLLNYEKGHYQELYQKAQDASGQLSGQLQHTQVQFNAAVILGYLERFCGERDYLMAAVVVEQCDQYFNEHNKFYGNRVPIPAAMVSRYLQLREDVVMEKAQCMMTERYYGQDQESYTEEIRIIPSANGYSEEAVRAARTLWSIFWLYSDSVDMPAWQMAQFCAPGSDGPSQLSSRAFQPSTRELFEQVKADLMAQGALTEVDGVLKPVLNGQVVDNILYGDPDDPR